MAVNGTHGYESKKKTYTDKTKLNPAATWRYTEVLRHETISLCKKLNSIYIIFFTSDPPQ